MYYILWWSRFLPWELHRWGYIDGKKHGKMWSYLCPISYSFTIFTLTVAVMPTIGRPCLHKVVHSYSTLLFLHKLHSDRWCFSPLAGSVYMDRWELL
jgi:hypothetical protein